MSAGKKNSLGFPLSGDGRPSLPKGSFARSETHSQQFFYFGALEAVIPMTVSLSEPGQCGWRGGLSGAAWGPAGAAGGRGAPRALGQSARRHLRVGLPFAIRASPPSPPPPCWHFVLKCPGTGIQIDHILGHKISPDKFLKMNII